MNYIINSPRKIKLKDLLKIHLNFTYLIHLNPYLCDPKSVFVRFFPERIGIVHWVNRIIN